MNTTKRIILFILITFVLTYCLEIFVIGALKDNPAMLPYINMIVSLMMFIPAIGVVLTRVITKEGWRDAWIAPNFRGHIRHYVTAWLLTVGLIAAGTASYFLIWPNRFDPGMGLLAAQFSAQGITMSEQMMTTTLLIQLALGIFISPVINLIPSFGEEWGWRGYLVPKMVEKMNVVPAVLVSGVIWGLWHAPLTWIIGHNYGFGYAGYPYTGILAMCAFCIAVGTLFSYVSLKTRSCLPAAVGHATLNGFAAIGTLFVPDAAAIDPFVGPMPVGIIGGAGFIVTAIVLCVLMARDHKRGTLIAPPRATRAVSEEPQA